MQEEEENRRVLEVVVVKAVQEWTERFEKQEVFGALVKSAIVSPAPAQWVGLRRCVAGICTFLLGRSKEMKWGKCQSGVDR